MVKGFPVVRSFGDDVVRYRVAYEKTYKELSLLPIDMLPESVGEKAQFCRAVTTSLLIEFAKKEREGLAVFERTPPKPEPKVESISDGGVESVEKPSPVPSKMNSHDRAGLCSYWGKILIEEDKIDPKRVISRKLDAHMLPTGSFASLMRLKEDYKVKRWQDIDIYTLACWVYAEELMHLPSDKIPEGEE